MTKIALIILTLNASLAFSAGEVGTTAADFNFWSILDTQSALGHQTLQELSGKVTVLFFFGGGCPTCIGEAPKTEAFYQRYKGNNFAMVGLEIWDYSVNQVRAYKKNTGVTYPLLLGASAVKSYYGVDHNTGYFVVDPQGIIRYSLNVNSSPFDSVRVGRVVDSLLNTLQTVVELRDPAPVDIRLVAPNPYRPGMAIRLAGYSGSAPAILFFDLKGRAVKSPSSAGLYLLRVATPGVLFERRIVVVR